MFKRIKAARVLVPVQQSEDQRGTGIMASARGDLSDKARWLGANPAGTSMQHQGLQTTCAEIIIR